MTSSIKHPRAFAVLAVAICLISVIPIGDVSADSDSYYRYVIHPDGTVEGNYTPIGTSSSTGSYTSVNGANSGSWAFDEDGYGPFGSFYAAFNPAQNNRMIGHLDPDDLTRLVDGTSIAGQRYNVMWCLPTVYWLTDSNGNLILTDDPDTGGTAYAHTIDGHVYSYIGIGVYEGSSQTVNGQTILTSYTDVDPTGYKTRAALRDLANNQLVNTDGDGENGYAMIWSFYQWELYKYCSLTVMESWNSQSVAGSGSFDMYNDDGLTTGNHDTSGPYAGSYDRGGSGYRNQVKVFIEAPWGGMDEFVDGIIISSGRYYIDQSSVPTDGKTGEFITTPSGTIPTVDSWVTGFDPSTESSIWGMPTKSGNGSMYIPDLMRGASGNGPYSMTVGGGAVSTDDILSYAWYGGISSIDCSRLLSETYSNIGSRLSFVFDDDPCAIKSYTVTFSTGSSTSIPSQIIESGQTALTPSNPTLEGYVFDCWSTSPDTRVPYDFNTPVTSDLTLYAVWVETLVFTTTPTSQGTVSAVPRMAGTILCDAAGSRDYTSLLWDLGDGTLSTDNYVTHYYSEPGTYTVTLTTYNSRGADVTTFTVEVPEAPSGEDDDGLLLWIAIGLLAVLIVVVIATRLL